MITSKHIKEEVTKATDAVKEGNWFQKLIIKILTVIIKIVVNIRTNQKLIMNKLGIELLRPNTQETETTKKENDK